MSTSALNPLVEKIRAKYPGAYDDMDDATLTKRVLAKYPQYSDLAAPKIRPPQVNMQESGLAHALNPTESVANRGEGNFVAENPEQRAGLLGAAAIGAGGAALPESTLPFLGKQALGAAKAGAKAIPGAAAMGAINYAREKLPFGKYIPRGAEYLPLFMGGKGEAPAPAAAEEEAAASPEPEEAPAPQKAAPVTRKQVSDAVDSSLDVKPLQKDVPLRNQLPFLNSPGATEVKSTTRSARGLSAGGSSELSEPQARTAPPPAESTAVQDFHYDPAAKEMHVTGKNGRTYVYGEATPAQAQMFQEAESKGMAWKSIKDNNPYVAKIIDGKRISVKPANPPSDDLTSILTKSLQQARQ